MKPKVLFILHIPPPIDGAAMVGQYIKNSTIINEHFDADYINLSAAFDLKEIGKFNAAKFNVIWNILKEVLGILRTNKYDLCYMTLTAKGPGYYKDFLVVVLLKLYKSKIIFHFHNKGVAQSSKNWFNHILYKFVFKNTQSILLAPTLYKDIQKYVPENKVYICNNGIPKIELTSFNTSATKDASDFCKFLFLSNMMEEKGVFQLLEACAILKAKNLKFQCDFIGGWSDVPEADFKHKIKLLGLQNEIRLHGKKYDEEKIKFFQNADVFVLPTYYHNECFPLVLLEAMQFALPVISTPEGAISEIVLENETGILTKQKDVIALANAMEFMLKNPKERLKMGTLGQIRYNKLYTLHTFEERMSAILKASIEVK